MSDINDVKDAEEDEDIEDDAEPTIRFRVVLPDKKNSKDDLTFCPVQSFHTEKVAKDFAALLALHHFQVHSNKYY
jgi:hypothetical protein